MPQHKYMMDPSGATITTELPDTDAAEIRRHASERTGVRELSGPEDLDGIIGYINLTLFNEGAGGERAGFVLDTDLPDSALVSFALYAALKAVAKQAEVDVQMGAVSIPDDISSIMGGGK